ncbi:MAG TPA: universal stress protein [Propionibacteriaceae bacterium]|nr:universal stress protein [Propionibacteriaceae bacterium]
MVAELEQAGVPAELRQISDGRDVAEVLEAVATELAADLTVIGLRQRSPLGKLILGSAATRILLTATHRVLAVKAQS